MRRTLLSLVATLCSLGTLHAQEPRVAYLFVYFTGNAPEQEQICYALSDDGYNFTPLNGGLPVIASDTIAFSQCVRDPHILRGEDGQTFYMVATDMKSSLGWSSNRGLVMMRSTDLVHWTHHCVNFPTRFPSQWADVTRVWAPQTIYDRQAGRYMVYYSLLSDTPQAYDRIYYSYANEDFSDLDTPPQHLFDNGAATIDGDIVYNPSSRRYHLFYKSEAGRGIYQATAATLTHPDGQPTGSQWTRIEANVEQTPQGVEGVGVCRSIDEKEWIVMYDCYMNGHYQFCRSQSLEHFQRVQDTPTQGLFTPRHGTLIPITQAEKERLLAAYGPRPNPILPGFHADPEVIYSHLTGRYYIYSTTDGHPGWGGYTFNVFESEDLVHWTDCGEVLDVKGPQVAWAKGNAWAPAVEEVKQPDGSYRYYLYFSADAGIRKEIGVAVASSPTGPFVDSGAPIVSESPTGHGQQIDVDVFRDPRSGKYYLYWGNSYMAGAELMPDMKTLRSETLTVLTPQGGTLATWAYREAPYVFYRKGKYYFTWSVDDTGSPNYHVCYGTSTSPLSPIQVADEPVILQQRPADSIYGTAHNAVLQIPGRDEWYIFYHRINAHFLRPSRQPGIHRQVCADSLAFGPKGEILPVTPTHHGPAPLHNKRHKKRRNARAEHLSSPLSR